jgi:uncharacterized protein with PQ loop repeat
MTSWALPLRLLFRMLTASSKCFKSNHLSPANQLITSNTIPIMAIVSENWLCANFTPTTAAACGLHGTFTHFITLNQKISITSTKSPESLSVFQTQDISVKNWLRLAVVVTECGSTVDISENDVEWTIIRPARDMFIVWRKWTGKGNYFGWAKANCLV